MCASTAIAPMSTTATACSPTPSAIPYQFNGTPIAQGNYIWFNSVLKVGGLSSTQTATISFTNQTITFNAPGGPYTLAVPDATVTYCPSCTPATTTFSGTWMTSVPSNLAGGQNTFLSGLAFQVPTSFLGNIKPVTWSGTFSSSLPGVTISWKWGAAVYTTFDGSMVNLGVKPTDKPTSVYNNADHAGTPENYKQSVIGGATGGGGANKTGSGSSTQKVTCPTGATTTTSNSTTTTGTASTTTTTKTTTTTFPQFCANCGGCGPDEGCVLVRGQLGVQCACAPLPACGLVSASSCGGNCPFGSYDCHFDTSNGQCLCQTGNICRLKGSRCTAGADCCSGLCDATGYCGCRALGVACTQALDCCSNTCAGTCCLPTSSPCTAGSDCCSGICDRTGHCACLPAGAPCSGDPACCNHYCISGACS